MYRDVFCNSDFDYSDKTSPFGHLCTRNIVLVLRYCYCRQYSYDRYHDHQFYQGEARIKSFHTGILNPNNSGV